jgi:hypothetical protein
MATLPLQGALAKLGAHGSKRFPSYKAAEIQRTSKYLFNNGSMVYLIRQPDGKTWIMQAYAKVVDPTLNLNALSGLGLKNLPAGWKFEAKTLDQDLTVSLPADKGHLAHVLRTKLTMFTKAAASTPPTIMSLKLGRSKNKTVGETEIAGVAHFAGRRYGLRSRRDISRPRSGSDCARCRCVSRDRAASRRPETLVRLGA